MCPICEAAYSEPAEILPSFPQLASPKSSSLLLDDHVKENEGATIGSQGSHHLAQLSAQEATTGKSCGKSQ